MARGAMLLPRCGPQPPRGISRLPPILRRYTCRFQGGNCFRRKLRPISSSSSMVRSFMLTRWPRGRRLMILPAFARSMPTPARNCTAACTSMECPISTNHVTLRHGFYRRTSQWTPRSHILQDSWESSWWKQVAPPCDSAAFALNNSSIINARARIPHTKGRGIPTRGLCATGSIPKIRPSEL